MIESLPKNVISKSIHFFAKKERMQLWGFVFLQILISIFDLVAVILSGALSLQVLQLLNGNNSETFLSNYQLFQNMQSEKRLLLISILTFTFFILRTFSSILVNRAILNYLSGKTASISHQLIKNYFSLPLDRQQNYDSQNTQYAISDGVDRAILGTLGRAIVLSVDFISTFLILALMLIFSPLIALCIIIYFGIAIHLLNRYSTRRITKYGNVKIESNIRIKSIFTLIQNNFRELFLSAKIGKQIDLMGDLKAKSAKASADQILISNLNKYIFESIIVLAFVIFFGFQALASNSMPGGVEIGILGAGIIRLIPILLRLHQGNLEIKTTLSEACKTFQLIDHLSRDSFDNYGESSFQNIIANSKICLVEFSSVDFAYDSRFRIKELNFSYSSPNLVAIIGHNGSGKSTLLDLIAGIINPTSGCAHINGLPARKFAMQNPGMISYVPQDIHMFGATLKENINLVNIESSSFSKEELFGVFNMDISPDSIIPNLSGGQKQKMSLLRANLNNSMIVLLDEPTSALDTSGEREFQMWLSSIKMEKLIFIVAHRMETIRQADSVIYMENGGIVHTGNLETSYDFVKKLQSNEEIF